MTTKSGSAVRKVLREAVLLKHVWDLGDTKLFDAAVLPAVILFTKSASPAGANPGFTSIYETDGAASGSARDVIAALAESGAVSLPDARRFEVTQGSLDLSTAVEEIWRVATEKTDAWLKTVADHTWRTWGEIGSIRVGVKTCADKVFIRSDWIAWVSMRGRNSCDRLPRTTWAGDSRLMPPRQGVKFYTPTR